MQRKKAYSFPPVTTAENEENLIGSTGVEIHGFKLIPLTEKLAKARTIEYYGSWQRHSDMLLATSEKREWSPFSSTGSEDYGGV